MARFPGVYSQVVDNSLTTATQGQFTCGLVGPAQMGPFNTAVTVNSLSGFVTTFGQSVAGGYLADAVNAITQVGNNISIVRVGRQYTNAIAQASGTVGSYSIFTSASSGVSPGQYVRLTQVGLPSTTNALVSSTSTGTVTLVSSGVNAVPLAATYTAAAVLSSTTTAAAAPAEAVLQAPQYTAAQTVAGTVTGTKGNYYFTVNGTASVLQVGAAIKITQANYATTREAIIGSIVGNTVYLLTTTNTASGQQAVPLQDSYTAGVIYVQTGQYTPACYLAGATAGSWANSTGTSGSGLVVNVLPGTVQDTKKILIYLNGALLETYNNLVWSNPSDPNYWVTVLANDSYVVVRDSTLLSTEPPANTLNPWNVATYPTVNVAYFQGGFDGSNVQDSDILGTIDYSGNATGLKVFADPQNYGGLYVLAAPGFCSVAVQQGLTQVANTLNAVAILDIPDNLSASQASDWSNSLGAYSTNGVVSTFRGAQYWNWIQTTDPFSGAAVFVPPSVGVLAAIAQAFNQRQPWSAAAGQQHGTIPIATSVRYPRVSSSSQAILQGNGGVVNPILLYNSTAPLIWGDLTTLRVPLNSTDALQSLAVVHLVNYIVKNMSAIALRYIFDPNDPVLAGQLQLEFEQLLDSVQNSRGITSYQLSILQTAAMLNNFSLTVNLTIVPIVPVYEIDLNVTVDAAGAVLASSTTSLISS